MPLKANGECEACVDGNISEASEMHEAVCSATYEKRVRAKAYTQKPALSFPSTFRFPVFPFIEFLPAFAKWKFNNGSKRRNEDVLLFGNYSPNSWRYCVNVVNFPGKDYRRSM